jgi:hypothetical protein
MPRSNNKKGKNTNNTMPEILCNIDAIAIGGNERVLKSKLTGLFLFTIGFFLSKHGI